MILYPASIAILDFTLVKVVLAKNAVKAVHIALSTQAAMLAALASTIQKLDVCHAVPTVRCVMMAPTAVICAIPVTIPQKIPPIQAPISVTHAQTAIAPTAPIQCACSATMEWWL